MLSSVEVRTVRGDLLTLPLEDVSDGFIVQDIDGLDPTKAVLVSSSFANVDGEQYQSSRREKRNIILTLGLEPDYTQKTVRQLRSDLYKFFMPKSAVHLTFYTTDDAPVTIVGRVESFDSALFTAEPTVTISLLCFDPDFVNPTPVIFNGTSTTTVNESLLQYAGTVETGFVLRMTAPRVLSGFTLFNRASDDVQRSLEFDEPLSTGDIIEISTVSGAKGAYLTRAGARSSVLYGMTPFSDWLNLFPGNNYIRMGIGTTPNVAFTIEFTKKYGGL